MPCPRCQHENPSGQRFCGACGTPLTANPTGPPVPSYAEITSALTEAQEQQTATAEILRVISRSPTDLQPVLDAVAESAARVCGAADSHICLLESDVLRVVAIHGEHRPSVAVGDTLSATPATVSGRVVRERRTIHIDDFEALPETEYIETRGHIRADRMPNRTQLAVPLLREGVPLGSIVIRRHVVQPFSEKQIALLETFAAQAVIAIENVRLFNETKEALEQQTATSEVLKVISRSTFDLQPVLETLIENATRLCGAQQGFIFRSDGEHYRLTVDYNAPPAFREWADRYPIRRGDGSVVGRVALEARAIQILDAQADTEWRARNVEATGISGIRTLLGVPMRREGELIGVIAMWRMEVRPFTDKQIDLVETFADQAVIAIENVRLFTELQTSNRELTTALDTQTATSEILRVISRSQTDVQPVFDAIVNSAVRLLAGYAGVMTRVAGDQIVLVAHTSTDDVGDATLRATFPRPLDAVGTSPQAIRDRAPVNITDAQTDPQLSEAGHAIARARGYHSMVAVPMLQHDEALGAIAVTRQEPGGFTDDEVALLQTFADQAVIAIENVRLFTELQEKNRALTQAHAQVTESLEQQTATGEILRVIASSPTDTQPVLDTIARNAARVCEGLHGVVFRSDGTLIRLAAHHGLSPARLDALTQQYPKGLDAEDSLAARAVRSRLVVHSPDIPNDPAAPAWLRELSRAEGFGSLVIVPMVHEKSSLGTLNVTRPKGAFTEHQIAAAPHVRRPGGDRDRERAAVPGTGSPDG